MHLLIGVIVCDEAQSPTQRDFVNEHNAHDKKP